MPMLTRPAFGPRTALAYVTLGALMCVWTAVWYYTRGGRELTRSEWFWVSGLFLTGLTFLFLGLVLGRLGRAARQAELPPEEATGAEAGIQQTAAANPPAVAVQPGMPGMTAMPGQVPAAPAAPAMPAAPAAPPGSIMPGTVR